MAQDEVIMKTHETNNLKKAEPFLNKDGRLEVPDFMSPDMARDMLQQRLDATASRMRKMACANARIIVTDASVDEKTKTVHPGDIQFDKDHCQNDRRNGSKYCQVCSDKHHAVSSS